MHTGFLAVVGVIIGSLVAGTAGADNVPAGRTQQALHLCQQADGLQPKQREAVLMEGLRLAEAAVKHNDVDPRAHFAVFCTLGKLVEQRGPGLGSFRKVRRLRREIDRALELAPDYERALAAKAEFLIRVPAWLGGDPAEAERLLFRARVIRQQRDLTLERVSATDQTRLAGSVN